MSAVLGPVVTRDANAFWLRAGLWLLLAYLGVTLLLPLYALLSRSVEDAAGHFIGLANFAEYLSRPALRASLGNSLLVAGLTTLIVTATAFVYAYALTRSCIPARGAFRLVALSPLLAPSLLPAIALVYLFGRQGVIRDWLFGEPIYGPIGIVIGSCFWTFPHALTILLIALAGADGRLYEAATALGSSHWRTFRTVTLPGAKYGLISAALVTFTLTLTDFGVPKVIGGDYPVLATDVYKQVVGQQNFRMGAVVAIVLLLPALAAFILERRIGRHHSALSSRAQPYLPTPRPARDWPLFACCSLLAVALLGILGMAVYASLVRLWPYDLTLTLANYNFDLRDGGSWLAYRNSLWLATLTALAGTTLVFLGAWLCEKVPALPWLRGLIHMLALLPMAVPGLVLGIAYILFFNHPGNPLHGLYGTLAILVIATVAHFYTVGHLGAVTALRQLDPEYEAVGASLRTPAWRLLGRVTLPLCLPALLDLAMYFFVNALTTVSAVVFLYSPDTVLAAVAILNMDDAGDVAGAAAMAVMIFLTAAMVRTLYAQLSARLLRRLQPWRAGSRA
ncbi:putative 2-aminoethylphosphonate ABC transporter permease subunit [Plasticicumulans acidivorans]|uniref:Iron(III) transport system permease protein n=1 Tax=Plasticicumulans acidivorans TaxID=886464 RepID=A0A317MZZ9_9GAMM|nr:putative 2-aminoethylphosphonate ABC transporter permease subunit [Plasticicumulans acidivorans]PWV65573.1 iron(III) transport system permease protein [Plasticicumulans acidivorans]